MCSAHSKRKSDGLCNGIGRTYLRLTSNRGAADVPSSRRVYGDVPGKNGDVMSDPTSR